MTDEPNAASAAEAQPELKSTDTRVQIEAPKAETPKDEPKVETPKETVPKDAPKEQPKDAGDEPPEGDDAPTADSQPDKPKEKRLPRWMKERLERERQVTEARTREAMLREFQASKPKDEPAKAEPATADKTLEDFDFDQEKYLDWKVQRALEVKEQQARDTAAQKKQADAAESLKARIDALEEAVGDGAWEDVTSSPINTNPEFKPLVDLFMGDEHDVEIAHHLATHLTDAERILALPRIKQIREIAKIAEQFDDMPPADKAAAPPKKTTNAPPPPKTVSGAGKPSVDILSPELTTAQRIAMWRKKA